MLIKLLLIIVEVYNYLSDLILGRIADKHDEKPLPKEVASIYDAERYSAYLSRHADYRRLSYMEGIVIFLLNISYIITPFYRWIEQLAGGNVYWILIATVVISSLLNELVTLPFTYYSTFTIEERYGLNKSTRKEFFKDEATDELTSLITGVVLFVFIAFVCEWIGALLGQYDIGYGIATLIVIGIFAALVVLAIGISALSLVSMRLKYRFTDLEDGELKEKILAMTKDCKKKVKRIRVYNESSKSTSKNAFLLRFLGYREFGIADNFLDGNSERELLAVLAHEVGHLKYKKKLRDHLSHIPSLILLGFMVWAIPNAHVFTMLNNAVCEAFGLQYTNYDLILGVVLVFLRPFLFFNRTLTRYQSRKKEYDADANSVDLGYGEELKATFMKLSNDELINVNPAPIIEFLEYTHPGMYNRIKAINSRMGS